MDLSLTEAEGDLVELCREFATKEIAPRAPAAWEAAECPTDLLREMGELGLLGLLVPEEWGGIGMSTIGLRGGDGAAGPGGPVRGGSMAGARDDRLAAPVPVRRRRTERALAATARRGTC